MVMAKTASRGKSLEREGDLSVSALMIVPEFKVPKTINNRFITFIPRRIPSSGATCHQQWVPVLNGQRKPFVPAPAICKSFMSGPDGESE